jgi:VanZ family protein
MAKGNFYKIMKVLLPILIIATLLFIYTRSMKTREQSSAESDAVGDIIEEIIPPETPVGGYVQNNIRKIAHFVEFAILGAEVAVYLVVYYRKKMLIAASFPAGLIAALFDETIQIFSKRGHAVTDVWLDFSGFASSSIIIYTGAMLFLYILKKRKQKLSNNGDN